MSNLYVLLGAALVPLIVGTLWYSPFMFVNPWMKAAGVSADKPSAGSMVLSMVVLYIGSFLIATALMSLTIHQLSLGSIIADEPGAREKTGEAYTMMMAFMDKYGHNFRTFKHGAFHGALSAIFFALPLIASTALFEKRGWKYIAITFGFWLVNLTLMGGIVCQFIDLSKF